MIWFRFVIIGMLSLTAISVLSYQGIEFYHALKDYLNLNKYL